MSKLLDNPFLEGSEQVSEEEAHAAAEALAKEAAVIRARASEIKEKAAKARVAKEAARKAELIRTEAELAAARAQVIKTVASIPKASNKPTIRPTPPPRSETLVLSSGSVVTSDSQKTSLLEEPVGILDIMLDTASAAVAVTSAFLIFKGM